MNAFVEIFTQNGVAQSILMLSLTILLGILANKIKIGSISLGVTWILFVGIIIGHFQIFQEDAKVLTFIKEFGLILFVYAVGSQCGANFFSSLKNGGLSLNILAFGLVLLNVLVTFGLSVFSGTDLPSMTGLMSGAVTNTPGLGAAQQTYTDITGNDASFIAAGYAIAYPMGVIGVVIIFVLLRKLCVDKNVVKDTEETKDVIKAVSMKVSNPESTGVSLASLKHTIGEQFVITRLCHSESNEIEMPTAQTELHLDDKICVVATESALKKVEKYVGECIDMDMKRWEKLDTRFVSKRLLVTQSNIDGKTIGSLKANDIFGLNLSRVVRSGVTMTPTDSFKLQLGDTLVAVGSEDAVRKFALYIGNAPKKLNNPYLLPIFLGIFVGVFFGMIPFHIPGIPQPVKLGLAGGPLIVAILLNRFGYKMRIVTYATSSALRMLQELGIAMFLAAVGLSSGKIFWATLVEHGAMWFLYGTLITMLPIAIIATIGRWVFKLELLQILGLVSGATTNPAALAFANESDDTGKVSLSYATVYPLSMLLRIMAGQFLILLFF